MLFCLPAYMYAHNRNALIRDRKPQAKLTAFKKKSYYKKSRPTHDLEKRAINSAWCKSFPCLEMWNNGFFFRRQFPHTHEWPQVAPVEIVKQGTVPRLHIFQHICVKYKHKPKEGF